MRAFDKVAAIAPVAGAFELGNCFAKEPISVIISMERRQARYYTTAASRS